jgi:nicotinamidase-related amidase
MKKLLIVVDYQNDFVNGSLGFPAATQYYDRIKDLIQSFHGAGNDVVFTKDLHDDSYLHTEEGRNLPVMHCLKNTDGAKFYGELEDISRNYPVFEKETFGSYALAKWLNGKDYSEIVLCGLDLSICVLANAIIAKSSCPDAHIVVDLSASGCGDPKAAETAIAALRRLEVEVVDLSQPRKNYL